MTTPQLKPGHLGIRNGADSLLTVDAIGDHSIAFVSSNPGGGHASIDVSDTTDLRALIDHLTIQLNRIEAAETLRTRETYRSSDTARSETEP